MSGPVFPTLSLWQPWASLVAARLKRLETRSWPPHRDLIGTRMAFASTATLPAGARDALRHGAPNSQALIDGVRAAGFEIAWDRKKLITNLPLGRVLCTARVTGSYPMVEAAPATHGAAAAPVAWEAPCLVIGRRQLILVTAEGDIDVTDQRPFGDFAPGRFAWTLEDVQPVDGDHPATGRQGIWNWRPKTLF